MIHIVIPMSGTGQRFIKAGYDVPKPLIVIDDKPIIAHVIELFTQCDQPCRFTFICNEQHLTTTDMAKTLEFWAPDGKIVSIAAHKKGPVFAVLQALDEIKDDEPTLVNYCDFGTYWNFSDFLTRVENQQADAAVIAYKGFHPHMLGPTHYAFMREKNGFMLEIREKQPYTDNRMQEYASNGTYYFKKGRYIKRYFQQLIDQDIHVNHEYYVSLVYNLLLADQLKISIYEIEHMLQWGTPEDVEEYTNWSHLFKRLCLPILPSIPLKPDTHLIMPMAGLGSRFSTEGYKTPKPLLEVSGLPMVVQASNTLPHCRQQRFICLAQHLENNNIQSTLHHYYPNSEIITLQHLTQGQAITVEQGLKELPEQTPIFIGACDNGMLFDPQALESLIADETIDAIVFSFIGYHNALRNPNMYGWLKTDAHHQVLDVSVKQPISDHPKHDHGIVGSFYFKNIQLFNTGLHYLKEHNIRINNEYYVDSIIKALIDLGYRVISFPIDHYMCWGTPNDYRSFRYWQSYFHKAPDHPYRLELDPLVDQDKIDSLTADVMGLLKHQHYL